MTNIKTSQIVTFEKKVGLATIVAEVIDGTLTCFTMISTKLGSNKEYLDLKVESEDPTAASSLSDLDKVNALTDAIAEVSALARKAIWDYVNGGEDDDFPKCVDGCECGCHQRTNQWYCTPTCKERWSGNCDCKFDCMNTCDYWTSREKLTEDEMAGDTECKRQYAGRGFFNTSRDARIALRMLEEYGHNDLDFQLKVDAGTGVFVDTAMIIVTGKGGQ